MLQAKILWEANLLKEISWKYQNILSETAVRLKGVYLIAHIP